jgi:hypothetical protein
MGPDARVGKYSHPTTQALLTGQRGDGNCTWLPSPVRSSTRRVPSSTNAPLGPSILACSWFLDESSALPLN